ncbi:MAG: DNA mismatch repair protein MutS [Bacillota bacterium]|nr:DNA mismatch repair protein MutS [Bacillota bacterium]
MSRSSPMMEQYRTVKEQHPDKLLMFQVGDFYEFFFEDAYTAAREMDIALTSRDAGSENPVPLAGVPIHAAEIYLNRLLSKGYRVVICEQVEDASQAKGLVKRKVTRILTPGTITDPEMLEESRNNYLAVVVGDESKGCYGLAAIDVSTGTFEITEQRGDGAWEIITDELTRLQPAELLCSSEEIKAASRNLFGSGHKGLIDLYNPVTALEEVQELIRGQWEEDNWENLELHNYPFAAQAAATALVYLSALQQLPAGAKHFHHLDLYFPRENMSLDATTVRNLELYRSLREGEKQGSLLGLLDHCVTAMGKRLMRRWVEQPLCRKGLIEKRLEAVEEFVRKPLLRRKISSIQRDIFDLERFCSRLSYERVTARDLVALKNTLQSIEILKEQTAGCNSELTRNAGQGMPSFRDLIELLEKALVEDPPLSLKEGGLFKKGYDDEVDRLRKYARESSDILLEFEKREKERTGIKSMRIGYNRNFGYYIEVTKPNLNLVPPEYHRKQTLVNAERYTTEELNTMEDEIISAREKIAALEYSLFEDLRQKISRDYTNNLLEASFSTAVVDCIRTLAEQAEKNDYSRPYFSNSSQMQIKKARHPVVEQMVAERFIPNDIKMDQREFLLIITGPNMAGKSTYIRSAALIAVMAQMGSFVPAEKAEMPVFDRIFARVGASDDLSRGQSTFMVEMKETASILKEATRDSLIILDEIGRGTSTYDGMSIARSVIEYIVKKMQSKTLFSTHYHELTDLEGEIEGIKNYTMAVKERGKEVIFLRQIVAGRADKSYGINVARLAGVPLEVLIRAEEILVELELASSSASERQLSLLPMVTNPAENHSREFEIIDELKNIDLDNTTPLEALHKMFSLQQALLGDDEHNTVGDEHR